MRDARGIWAVVVAAGKGERLGLPYNKVFYRLAGRSVLGRCLDALADAGCFEGAVLVLSEADMERYEQLRKDEGAHSLVRRVVAGGGTRQASVFSGLTALPDDARIVAIHDAARAFVPREVVLACVESALERGSGVAATRLTDTIKRVDADGLAVDTPDRDALRAVQTPQCFDARRIKSAHERAERDGFSATDDAALFERYEGGAVLCVSEAGKRNVKLTTMADLLEMEARPLDMRVGHGYDVHRLAPDRKLILCGVDIPHEKGLLGHSDADVAAHALMDALLGAAAMGDIGRHFPDSDERYRGASSIALLRQVADKLADAGFCPRNVDVTIVCQRPKLAGYRERMRESLAEALGLAVEFVNVKATTTEGLGFEGTGEGISASAVATLTSRDIGKL